MFCRPCAQQYFANWDDEGVVDFHKEFSNLITNTAARTLLGEPLVDFGPHARQATACNHSHRLQPQLSQASTLMLACRPLAAVHVHLRCSFGTVYNHQSSRQGHTLTSHCISHAQRMLSTVVKLQMVH